MRHARVSARIRGPHLLTSSDAMAIEVLLSSFIGHSRPALHDEDARKRWVGATILQTCATMTSGMGCGGMLLALARLLVLGRSKRRRCRRRTWSRPSDPSPITLPRSTSRRCSQPASNFGGVRLAQALYQARRAALDEIIGNALHRCRSQGARHRPASARRAGDHRQGRQPPPTRTSRSGTRTTRARAGRDARPGPRSDQALLIEERMARARSSSSTG